MGELYSLYRGGSGEIEEKKSRFIANIAPAATVEEANDFIARIKKQYWDAKHNCSALIVGKAGENVRSSDDGEPSGTAGRPMLEVLMGEGLTDVVVVVTRYFGGTLLGTGGLIRAYQAAVKEGLKNCCILKKLDGVRLKTVCDYTDYGKLQFICSKNNYYIEQTDYSDKLNISILLEQAQAAEAVKAITDATGGRAKIDADEKVCYAMIDGLPQIFDV